MEIKHGSKSFYIGELENKPLAEMSYVVSSDKLIIIDHTNVPIEMSGQGVGKKLLKELTDWARVQDIKIMPLCPFAKVQMEKTEEYQDLIYK
ncbi:MAG: GNAT family N-acetyltransferase [Clostridiaceae bacterium]